MEKADGISGWLNKENVYLAVGTNNTLHLGLCPWHPNSIVKCNVWLYRNINEKLKSKSNRLQAVWKNCCKTKQKRYLPICQLGRINALFAVSTNNTMHLGSCLWHLNSIAKISLDIYIYINIIKKLESTLNRLQIVWNCSFQKQWENADSPLSLPTGRNERPSCCRHQQHFACGVVSLASEHIAKRLVWIYNNSNEKLEYTPNRPKL